jgi:hypothetical protein
MQGQMVWNLWKLLIFILTATAAYMLVSELYPDVEAGWFGTASSRASTARRSNHRF